VLGKFYNLLKSYFGGRYQKVTIGPSSSTESTWDETKQAVQQGSIFGPIFFLISINDLPNLAPIDSKIFLYADDTSIVVTRDFHGHHFQQPL
jgi:hypothetical protein